MPEEMLEATAEEIAADLDLREFIETNGIKSITMLSEMKKSYMEYAMSVIVSRALPDARDGLKPVHRRILYGAFNSGFVSSSPFRKSARIVGDVMGSYHPHGDSSIYDAMVRMVQPFYMRAPLIDGQGNFGSIDGDPAAAMRYSEARLSKLADAGLIKDVDVRIKNSPFTTVGWRSNYNEETDEPKVLPARFPNILVNGGQGIAVGMASNMPSHNLGEVIDATLAYMADPDITVEALMEIVPGPDFPTGGVVLGRGPVRQAFETGRGSVVVSGVAKIEKTKAGREVIAISEIPYGVNKAQLVARIAELATGRYADKKEKDKGVVLEGIQDIRDESSREGMRIAVDVKRDADGNTVLNNIRKHTRFKETFGVNNVCLNADGGPELMGLRRILETFVEFRRRTVAERTKVLLEKARVAYEKQVGLYAARDRIDEVIAIIRASTDRDEARAKLMTMQFANEGELSVLVLEIDPDAPFDPTFRLGDDQVSGILDMQVGSLSRLMLDGIASKARELLASRRAYLDILNDPAVLDEVIRAEMAEIRAKFPMPRLTRIEAEDTSQIDDDELVPLRSVMLTMTQKGYVKWTPLDSYREQSRGGKGKVGMDTSESDFVALNMVCTSRTPLLIFTSRGKVHATKTYKLPEAAANARGRFIGNFMPPMAEGETIAALLAMPIGNDGLDESYLMFVTDKGDVRRNAASDFTSVNKSGKIAMKLEDEHGRPIARLLTVAHCSEGEDLVLGTAGGRGVRFPIDAVRVFKGRDSIGIKGVTLAGKTDLVVSACVIAHFDASPEERDAYLAGGTHRWKDESGAESTLTLDVGRMSDMAKAERMLLTVSAKGFGKMFSSHEFRTTNRGALGVTVGTFNDATGPLVSLVGVEDEDGIVLVTDGGQTIRTRPSEIRKTGRAARGVRLFDLANDHSIVSVARIESNGTPG